jgi:hypothetical protein
MGRWGARRRCGRRRHVGGACAVDARAGRGSAVFDQSNSCENAATVMYDTGRCVLRPMTVLLHMILRSSHAPACGSVSALGMSVRVLLRTALRLHTLLHTHIYVRHAWCLFPLRI